MRIVKYPVVFDTDCISSFSWVNRFDILFNVFDGELIISAQVYDELAKMRSFKNSDFVFYNVEREVQKNKISVVTFSVNSYGGKLYLEFIAGKATGKIIGKGEASAISIARVRDGTVASNNFSDIAEYCRKNGIAFTCTDEILYTAYKNGYIDIAGGEYIRNEMKKKKRKLPECSFTEVVEKYDRIFK